MITQKYHESLQIPTLLKKYGSIDKILFFDIETTGLSPKTSFVYLISAGYFINNEFILVQLFAENVNEEENILKEFDNISEKFITLAQFNGEHFDIPYLKERYNRHNVIPHISTMESLDIYLYLKPLKKLFDICNCKLKTFEKLIKIQRDDLIDGGEAINQYYHYVSTKDEAALAACLLHNYEDVLNLPKLSFLMIFDQFKDAEDFDINVEFYTDMLTMSIKTDCKLYLHLHYDYNDIMFDFKNNICTITLFIENNKIKLHYKDYKNYVFLNNENYAIETSYAKLLNLKKITKCDINDAYQTINIDNIKNFSNSDYVYLWNQSYGWLLQKIKLT